MKIPTIFIFALLLLTTALFAQYPTYRFDVGWNLIGGGSSPFPAEYLDTLEQIIPPVFSHNTATFDYDAAETIEPLMGYWVLSTDSFTMGEDTCDCPPTVTDIDGNVYETVLIGDQCWMAENLKTTHLRDGTPIPYVTDDTEWGAGVHPQPSRCCAYDNDSTNIETYGLLYNWYAVDDPSGLAPEGWHVPTDEEWKTLEMYLGMSEAASDSPGWRGTNEGSKMAGGYGLWEDGFLRESSAFGESGLDLLPAGYRTNAGPFYHMSYYSSCWSSSSYSTPSAWDRSLYYGRSDVTRYNYSKSSGFSVRCVRD